MTSVENFRQLLFELSSSENMTSALDGRVIYSRSHYGNENVNDFHNDHNSSVILITSCVSNLVL